MQSEQLVQRDVRKYDEAPEWQLPEPGAFASAKSFRDKVVMPFVNKLKILIKKSDNPVRKAERRSITASEGKEEIVR